MLRLKDVVEMIEDVKKDGYKDWEIGMFDDTLEDVKKLAENLKSKDSIELCNKFIKDMEENKVTQLAMSILDDVASEKKTTKSTKSNKGTKGTKSNKSTKGVPPMKGNKSTKDKKDAEKATKTTTENKEKKTDEKSDKKNKALSIDLIKVGDTIQMQATKNVNGAFLQVLDIDRDFALCKNLTDITSPVLLAPEDIVSSKITIKYPEEDIVQDGVTYHYPSETITHNLIFA